jgi:hypothetical protein
MAWTARATGPRASAHGLRGRAEPECGQIPLEADRVEAEDALDALPVLCLPLGSGLSRLQVGKFPKLGFECLYLLGHGRSPL